MTAEGDDDRLPLDRKNRIDLCFYGPVRSSQTEAHFFHLAMVFGLTPYRLELPGINHLAHRDPSDLRKEEGTEYVAGIRPSLLKPRNPTTVSQKAIAGAARTEICGASRMGSPA